MTSNTPPLPDPRSLNDQTLLVLAEGLEDLACQWRRRADEERSQAAEWMASWHGSARDFMARARADRTDREIDDGAFDGG